LAVNCYCSAYKIKKFEIRSTNFETNPKYEIKNVQNIELNMIKKVLEVLNFENSVFEIVSSFDIRVSNLKLRS